MKNCDAKCDAINAPRPIHLWLRNNTFLNFKGGV